MARKHKDVEFQIGQAVARTFEEAAALAMSQSLAHGRPVVVDVVVWSKAGARWYGGDDAVAQYKEDPEASVFERIVVQAQSQGRVP